MPPRLSPMAFNGGIDVTTTPQACLFAATDEEQLAFASGQGRVIFTHDDDFLRLHASGTDHAGIAYCHQEAHTLGEIIRGLVLIWEVYEPEDLKGRVEYL
jgi:hypothetical protein